MTVMIMETDDFTDLGAALMVNSDIVDNKFTMNIGRCKHSDRELELFLSHSPLIIGEER